MAVRVSYPAVWDDQEFYPLHEEDDVPENPPHEATGRYLRDAITARFPTWFVTGNALIYWEPGNKRACRAPDLLVVREPLAEAVHRVYQVWKQPPIALVAEIGSRSTYRRDQRPKREVYQDQIRAAEYYYAEPPHGDQRLWRLGPDGYEAVAPEANGRLRSAELELEFGLDEAGNLWLYTLEGERLLTHTESEEERRQEAHLRRQAERRQQAAEAQQTEEARLRQEAQAQQAEEAQRRQEAERLQQAAERQQAEEAQRRQEAERLQQAAEARVADLERQIAELRAGRGDS